MDLRKALIILLYLIGTCATLHAQPNKRLKDSIIQLDEVSVVPNYSLTTPTYTQALVSQRRIAGSTSLVEIKADNRHISTIKEALHLQPGVIIQDMFGGNDQPRLNIRGSGIQSNPQRRGVYLLQDGIPVNFADGSYAIGVMDASTAQYIEVFKGANAL